MEGSLHFEEKSAVFQALRKITNKLDEMGVPYAVVGGMAMFRHGYRRFTEVVDILVGRESVPLIHARLEGRGYLLPFQGSKQLRDTELGVRIEFLTTVDYPGDGKPKPVTVPAPEAVSVELEGIRYLNLQALIELKLASGMTNPARLRDLSDVLELIRALGLQSEFSDQLDPYVREKFRELYNAVRQDESSQSQ